MILRHRKMKYMGQFMVSCEGMVQLHKPCFHFDSLCFARAPYLHQGGGWSSQKVLGFTCCYTAQQNILEYKDGNCDQDCNFEQGFAVK